MESERARRVRELLERTLARPSEERASFLRGACPDDPELRDEVDRRRSIGPYELIRVIGEDGMSVVYEARQEVPVVRRVALKLIKHEIESEPVLARFESERQALVLMNHPNIARVLDAGADEQGAPWFAMELTRGEPISEYCDRHNLSAAQRVGLVIQVCGAVQHAHQKGVIHRDLKPANILVEVQDGRALPRVVGFGVAKAIDRQLTERALFTEYGQMIGTPEYMSPEQAEMTGLDVDSRTDIYSIGVLLYELLVGVPPFDPREFRRAGLDEVRRRIREETPSKPSTRVSSLGEEPGRVAGHRRSDPSTLARSCRGDLDRITMKALEKDRTRRYASASEFGEDLRRQLRNEPVTAGPSRAGYRVRKFVRRHRVSAGVTASLLLVSLAGTSVGLVRAVRAERQARLAAATAAEVSDFMVGMFEIDDPGESRGNSITAREVLDRGAARIRGELSARPEIQGRLLDTMGTIYRGLGLYDAAEPLLRSAVEAAVRTHGEMHSEVVTRLLHLGGLLVERGRAEDALPHLERALRIQDDVLGRNDLERAWTFNNIGRVHRMARRYDEALPYFDEVLRIREAVLGPDDPEVAEILVEIGQTRLQLGDRQAALGDLRRALAIRESRLGGGHPKTLDLMDTLAELQL